MKITAEKYAEIRDGIKTIVDGVGLETIKMHYAGKTVGRIMWDLFSALWFDKQFDDNHPSYVQGVKRRILPQTDPNWLNNLYNSGINDSHIETALKKVAKELNITETR